MEIIMPKFYETLKYELVPSKLEGDLTYIGDFDARSYQPFAVWRSANPNKDKGHKEFVCLFTKGDMLYVTGRDRPDIEKYLVRDAAHCHSCDQVLYSLYRHDYRHCKCQKIAVDGGSDYFKMSYATDAVFSIGKLNLETQVFTEDQAK